MSGLPERAQYPQYESQSDRRHSIRALSIDKYGPMRQGRESTIGYGHASLQGCVVQTLQWLQLLEFFNRPAIGLTNPEADPVWTCATTMFTRASHQSVTDTYLHEHSESDQLRGPYHALQGENEYLPPYTDT